ncbi:toll/interleukin-1 receptor domain-containing protein [Fibrobacter sp. UWH4]|uniref:toll/interleukin-1 receptor domain-containing protein n=1 Tax=Fibrobacter sp. UWH4 TaxID=1896210 RepID=UPI001587410C|nr:toll/interleukin-1 receptor domain-containing protein [Fibrobacter sp. UWH4]
MKIDSLNDVYKCYVESQNKRMQDIKFGVRKYGDRRIKDEEKLKFYEKINDDLNNDYNESNVTVFLSHAHEDLKYAYSVARFLKKAYNVNVYIDAFDPLMPSATNADTADKLIKKIKSADRFIFVGTKKSFMSKWCNWELGLGDSKSLRGHLAFLVMSNRNEKMGNFNENEYVGLYPFIWDKSMCGIESNEDVLYVGYHGLNNNTYVPLKDWLSKKNKFRYANTALSNRNVSLVVFFLSKFKKRAVEAMNFGTISGALEKMSFILGIPLKQCYCEFNLIFKSEQNGFNKSLPSRIALRCYNEWKDKPFDDLKQDVLHIKDDYERICYNDLSRS